MGEVEMTRTAGKARLAGAALAAMLAVLWAGPAQADTPIQIGQIAAPGNPFACGAPTNLVQGSVGAAPSYTFPSDGVITRWSHRGHNTTPGSGRLQVWRPAGGTNSTLVGRSKIQAFAAGLEHIFTTDILVSAGDVLGFRSSTFNTGCAFATVGDSIRTDNGGNDPAPGETRNLIGTVNGARLNISATFDPADAPPPPSGGPPSGDPPSGDPPSGEPSLDSSATKGKQSVDNLKIKLTVDQDSTLDLGGKAKVVQRAPASTAAKKKFKLKQKTGIGLQAGVKKVIGLKFKKNNKKKVKRIKKLLKSSKKARRNSKVVVNLTLTTAAGVASDSKLKIELKP